MLPRYISRLTIYRDLNVISRYNAASRIAIAKYVMMCILIQCEEKEKEKDKEGEVKRRRRGKKEKEKGKVGRKLYSNHVRVLRS